MKARIRVPGAPRVAATQPAHTVQPSPAQGLGSAMARTILPKTTAGDAFVNRAKELPRTTPPSTDSDPYSGPGSLYSQLRSRVVAKA
jgi:hypothetical protein